MDQQPSTTNLPAILKKKFWTRKKIIWTVIILLIAVPIAYKIFKPKDNSGNIQTDTVKKQNIKSTVLATGQVVSATDLNLSFQVSGFVRSINVKEGDKVKQGDVLASLDQNNQAASLTSARGALAQAKANYEKVLAGASSEDVAAAQTTLNNAKISLENTKKQQEVLVANAYTALLNSGLAAIAGTSNPDTVTATISGAYTATDQGVYKVTIYSTGAGFRFQVQGLESGDGIASTIPQPLGSRGLYIQFSSAVASSGDVWDINIPNTQASTYVANYNSYTAALQTQSSALSAAQSAVDSAQAALNLKIAQARPADIDASLAAILSAQGQVQAAQAALENTVIRAPAAGTITSVDVKVGELASAQKEVIILQDVGNLHVEANVSEANIAALKPGQAVDITFDSLGPDRHFQGAVQTVNPGATVVSGVVNYKVIASLSNVPEIKPGMTANMTILTDRKDGVLAMPLRAVINRDGKKYVRVIDDAKKKTYREAEIQTGMEADGGLVEVTAGVNEGQEVVTFIKK